MGLRLNSATGSQFASSFMQGYSFVDNIKHRRRQEKKLDEQLAHRRTIEDAREARAQKTHQVGLEETNRIRRERAMGQAGDTAALDQSVNLDEVIHLAPFSEQLRNRIVKERGEEELLGALKRVRDDQGSANTQTGGIDAGGLTGEVSDRAPTPELESQLGGSRGRDSLTSVDLDEVSDFDSEAPQGGFFSRLAGDTVENLEGAVNRVRGGARGLSVGVANSVNAGANAAFDTGLAPVASGASFGTEVGGNVMVPEAFTTEQEFSQISDPTEFEKARQSNKAIIDELKASAGNPEASRLTRLREGGRDAQAEARRQEFQVTQRYDGFGDPSKDNKFRELAAENPQAATTQYFRDRATLISANPNAAATMDAQMQPVIQAANFEYTEQLDATVVGTKENTLATVQLRNLQATQKQIYEDSSPSQAAGIDSRGLPVGNSQLTQNLMLAIDDPNRPRPIGSIPSRQIATAATVTNRMAGKRRATDRQIKDAVIMKDAGLASSEDVMTLTMTGRWPDKSPATTLKAYKPGDVVFAQGPDGSMRHVLTVPGGGSRTTNRAGNGNGQNNQITQAQLDQFEAGARTVFPDGSDEMITDMLGALLDDSDWVQENYDLRDPVAGNRLGRSYAQAITMSAAEDSGWIPNFVERWAGEAPTAREIMRSPDMAARLAVEHEIPMPLLPEQRFEGLDMNNMRQELSTPGKYPTVLMQAADPENGVTDEQLIQIVQRYDYLTSQQPEQ